MIRIVIIDDRKPVLQNLKELIKPEEEFKVVGVAENGQQGVELVEQLQPDVAIVDLIMPLKNGIETTYLITQNYPQTKVLILTGSDGRMLNKAILAGANGYLLKGTSREDLIAAISAISRNSVYIGTGILDRVQLSSVDSQQSKIKYISLWLAQEVLDWWCEHSSFQTFTAKQIIKDLSLDLSGLSWMKSFLCKVENTHFTLIDELELKVEDLFIEIGNYADSYYELSKRQTQISNWFTRQNSDRFHTDFSVILDNNYQSLRIVTLEKLQKIISSLWKEEAPIPSQNCLQLVKEYLLNWQQFLEQEYENIQAKENAAWHSFNYLLEAKEDVLPNKRELCKKTLLFIYRCKTDAKLNNLLVQLTLEIIKQLEIHIDILKKTNNLLSDLKKQLEQQHTPDLIALTPLLEQIFQKTLAEELRRDFERSTGQPLNQWGMTKSISKSEISNRLQEKLKPIAREIYLKLRKEALAISFLEYAEYN